MALSLALDFLLLGIFVGGVGTLIGAGGGFLLVPLLLLFYPNHSAAGLTAVSLTVVFFNAYAGSWAYARMGRIDYGPGLRFAVAGIPCALLGTWIVELIPRRAFDLIFGLTLLAIGILLLFRPLPRNTPNAAPADPKDDSPRELSSRDLLIGSVGSAYLGLLSSLLGIGGGILHVPFLVRVLRYPPHRATATSHFVLAIVSFVGAAAHLIHGDLNDLLPPTALVALGVMSGAPIGAMVSTRLRGPIIIRTLAVCLCAVALRLLL